MDNKHIFSKNLQKCMAEAGKTRMDVANALGISYYTVTSWVNGTKYPRMDKVERLAKYFDIQKSDLIEEKLTPKKEMDNDVMVNIIVRMRMDKDFLSLIQHIYQDQEFLSVVDALHNLDAAKLKGVQEMLKAFAE